MELSKGTPTPPDEEVRYVSVTKTLNLRVNTFENIDDVKNKFSEFESTETNLQKVFFTEGGFENDRELDFQRKDGSNVHLNLHYGVRLQVNIKVSWGDTTTDDKLVLLDVYSWDTIGDVKTKFQDKEGIPANELTLFYDGKQLDDLQTIAGHAIRNHSTLDAFFLGEDRIVIFVSPPGNDPNKVMVKLCSTIVNLKRMIHCMGHYAVDRQMLTFNGLVLENGRRLSDYNIQMGSELQLKFTRRTNGMQIFVQTLTGMPRTVYYVDSSDTVDNLKTEIRYVDGTLERNQRLKFNGKRLEDGHTLGDYNIVQGSTIHLAFRPFGC